ncbi:hypothetical protein HNO88_004023 [Novosphingobium chloroacetimidivorans]|uniref:DUF1134 domain-containing protein n=1 Tax=Novosphingobium chloroacetimidivorans TaxID=1428314 RepID=A0A7W7KEC2_9SPHN|nr:hypothetical protein [Novosphingobium chloroacetimidivorans]
MNILYLRTRWHRVAAALSLVTAAVGMPAAAQVRSVDPDAAIDGDLSPGQNVPASTPSPEYPGATNSGAYGNGTPVDTASRPPATTSEPPASVDDWSPQSIGTESQTTQGSTYRKDDLIGAAEGVFGKGAQGLASLIEDLLKKQGEPNAYIVGREGSGAIGIGLRYGSGTMHHKVEGTRAVYWTGPSIGFDAGLNAANAFVLVYNLYDTEDLYKRFPAGEGQAYLVGGFHVSYMRRGNVVLIPVRMGAGVRLGINAGYMKFTHEQKWIPF